MKIPFLPLRLERELPPFAHAEESPVALLASRERVDAIAAEMKAIAAEDLRRGSEPPRAMEAELARLGPWFQRIEVEPGLAATSRLERCIVDDGGLNNLGGRLSPEEASMTRPLPKLRMLAPILPDCGGKTFLEVGANAGFFSLEFARRGAARVTAVEVIPKYAAQARFAFGRAAAANIALIETDFCGPGALEPHDLVFASEAVNHMLFPFWALARMLSLAREWVVLETGLAKTSAANLSLHLFPGARYHSFEWSDGMLMSFLARVGVAPGKVRRFVNPVAPHAVYVIDVRGGIDLKVADYALGALPGGRAA